MARIASVLVLLLAGLPVWASSIETSTICDAYASGANVSIFRGLVVDVVQGPTAFVELARVRPLEVFKGSPGQEITITQPTMHMSEALVKGREYLIFARAPQANGEVWAGVQEIGSVDPEKLAWLRAYPTAPPTGRIFGVLSGTPLASDSPRLVVTLASMDNRTWTTSADQRNAYSFDGLTPGVYTVAASAPGSLLAMSLQGQAFDAYARGESVAPRPTLTGVVPKLNQAIVSVGPKGCSEVDFHIRYDSHIRGRVVDSSGKPVAGIEVGLIERGAMEPELERGRFAPRVRVKTDADGNYDLSQVDPGDYSIVLHPETPSAKDPYSPVFFPGKAMPWEAAMMHLGPAQNIPGVDFVEPDRLLPATVHVQVVRRDGTPIAGARIFVTDIANTIMGAGSATTDTGGRAELQILAGREYTVIAETPTPHGTLVPATPNSLPTIQPSPIQQEQPVCAGPVAFIAKDGLAVVPLTPDRTWDACRTAPRPQVQAGTIP